MSSGNPDTPWPRVLGIVGGLGPHAHIELERRLLKAVEPVASEQDYPPFVVASFPATPDRTNALLAGGESPAPMIVRSLEALAAAADYAVVACVTAHAFFDDVRPRSPLPILDLVETTLAEVVERHGASAHVGILATSGTLRSRLFSDTAKKVAPRLRVTSLLDLDGGDGVHEDCVMTPIYGPSRGGRRIGGRLKSGAEVDPDTGRPLVDRLRRAVARLAHEGADVVLAGCTEIGMTLGSGPLEGTVVLDPLDSAVRRALAVSRGERPLP